MCNCPAMAWLLRQFDGLAFAAMAASGRGCAGHTPSEPASIPPELVAQPLLALGDFGRHCIAEILHFVEGPDFKFTRPGHRIGAALGPGAGLVHALDLPDPVAGDQLARLGEGAVDHRPLRAVAGDPLAD